VAVRSRDRSRPFDSPTAPANVFGDSRLASPVDGSIVTSTEPIPTHGTVTDEYASTIDEHALTTDEHALTTDEHASAATGGV